MVLPFLPEEKKRDRIWRLTVPSPPTSPRRLVIYTPGLGALFGRSSDLQARTYSLLLPGPERASAIDELSFLLTAAGQSQILTGFPFQR